MSWVNNIPNSQAKQRFQTLVNKCVELHHTFCKPKNATYFEDIAEILDEMLNCLEKKSPPDETVIATLTTTLKTTLDQIARKKRGQHLQLEFNQLTRDVSDATTNLKSSFEEGIRFLKNKSADKKPESSSSTHMKVRQAIMHQFTPDQLRDFIDTLRDVPQQKSCSNLVNRAFSQHKVPTFTGLAAASAAVGSIIQSGVNAWLNASSVNNSPLTGPLDSRVATPAGLLLTGTALFAYSLFKSRPETIKKVPEAKSHIEHSFMDDEAKIDSQLGYNPFLNKV